MSKAIKRIPKEFKKGFGFGLDSEYTWKFKQLKRCNGIALYKRSRPLGNLTYYEVVEIRARQTRQKDDKVLKEVYPPKSDFGNYGFCYKEKEKALKKFREWVE